MPNVGNRRVLMLGTEDATLGTVAGVTTGTSAIIFGADRGIISVFYRSIGVTSGGTILIEEADINDREVMYNGTWGQLNSSAASAIGTNSQLAIHITNAAYRYIRIRISSPITGGGAISAVYCDQGA